MMRRFITLLLLVVLILGAVAAYYYYTQSAASKLIPPISDLVQPEPPQPPARTPQDYHILEDQGGIPKAEANRAGLTSADYAYLSAMVPTHISDGIEKVTEISVRGLNYDFCYRFNSTPPEMQSLEFNLNAQWEELHFGFGFDDAHPSDPEHRWGIELVVQVDGNDVYGPIEVTPVTDPLFAKVNVIGVHRVTFVSRRIGFKNPFAPVLLDPFVRKYSQADESSGG